MIAEFPLGAWLPDAPTFKNPGCVVANNVVATTGAWGPIPSFVATSNSITGRCIGATQFYKDSGASLTVGGTATTLFSRGTGAFDVTGGLTDPGPEETWDFCQFNNFVIATAQNNAPQYLSDINTDVTWSALPGSPPQAKTCARVGDFVMLGNMVGATSRIQWSAFNNPTGSWAADRQTQAGFADLQSDFGPVKKIVGGRFGLVFQERGVQRISYVGPPTVWRADILSRERGALSKHGVVTVGQLTYFLAQDGFYVTDGGGLQSISTQQVSEWFFNEAYQPALSLVQAAVDWQREAIVWSFASFDTGVFDRQIIYSWSQQRWSTASIRADWIFSVNSNGVSLEDLDALYGTLEAVPLSLDSKEFVGLDRVLSAFDASGTFGRFSGEPLEATWETAELQPSPGKRVHVSEVTGVMDAQEWDMQAALITKDNFGEEAVGALREVGSSGFCPVLGEGKKMRVRLIKPAGSEWSDAQAVQLRFRPAGTR